MENFKLTSKQITSLKALHKLQRDRKSADRVKAVVLLGTGWSVAQVSEVLLVDEQTIRNWFEKYRTGGDAELLAMHCEGRVCSLTVEQQQELARHLDEHTYIDSKAIAQYIAQTFGVKYSATGVKSLLHRIGFVYKKPKHIPGKLDPNAQKEFLAEYEKLRKTQGKTDVVYFCDACHPQHNSIPAYGWIRRGSDKELKSNGGRKRVNINGAVNVDTREVVTDFPKTINDRSTWRLFQKLEAKHPNAKKIHVIMDNATYYKSKWLKKKLETSRIVPHFLPAYSPNLNLIERLWKFLKKKILYHQYYEKFDDFVTACKSFFRCRTKLRDDLRSLLAENFQLFNTT